MRVEGPTFEPDRGHVLGPDLVLDEGCFAIVVSVRHDVIEFQEQCLSLA